MTTTEHWQPVLSWPEYSISSVGRIRSEARIILRSNGLKYRVPERILKLYQHPGTNSYSVVLSRPGQKERRYVNVLMRQAFPGTQPWRLKQIT